MTNLLLEDNKQYFLDAVGYFSTFFSIYYGPYSSQKFLICDRIWSYSLSNYMYLTIHN